MQWDIDSPAAFLYNKIVAHGALAQLGAHHVALTQPVKSGIKYRGELAQLGERVAGSDEVRGSSPLFSIRVWQKNGRVAVLFVYIYATVLYTCGVMGVANEKFTSFNACLKIVICKTD